MTASSPSFSGIPGNYSLEKSLVFGQGRPRPEQITYVSKLLWTQKIWSQEIKKAICPPARGTKYQSCLRGQD